MGVGADFPVYSRIRRFFPDFGGEEFPVRSYYRRLHRHFKYLIELMFQTTHRAVVGSGFDFYREFSRRTGNWRGSIGRGGGLRMALPAARRGVDRFR